MPPCATRASPNEPTVPLPERALRRLARARGAAARSAADAHRSRHAVRRVPATVLAAGGLRARPRRRAAAHPDHGRGPRGLPRPLGSRRPAAAAVHAPRDLARVRHPSGARHPLLLSRLGLRRGRPHPRDARRARRQHAQAAALPRGVPDARILRPRLRQHGAARRAARLPDVRHVRRAGPRATPGRAVPAAGQLAPREGQIDGPGAHVLPARDQQRLSLHRGLRRAGGIGVAGDAVRHALRRHPPRRRLRLGADLRFHGAQRPPVHARDRGGGLRAHRLAPRRDPLGRARGRHAHAELRAGAGRPGLGPDARADRAAGVRPVRRPALRGAPATAGRLRRAVEPANDRRARPRAPRLDRSRRDHAARDPARRHSRRRRRRDAARARGEARPDNHDVLPGHRPARPCLGDRRPRAAAPGRPPRRRRRPPAAVAPLSFLQQTASRACRGIVVYRGTREELLAQPRRMRMYQGLKPEQAAVVRRAAAAVGGGGRGARAPACGRRGGGARAAPRHKFVLTTTFAPVEGGFLLSGVKHFGSLGEHASFHFVTALIEGTTTATEGQQSALVPAGSPGISVDRNWDAVGMRATSSDTIKYDRCFVRREDCLGGIAALSTIDITGFALGYSAIYLGIGEAAFDYVLEYAKTQSFGLPEPLSHHPSTQRALGEMAIAIRAARALLREAPPAEQLRARRGQGAGGRHAFGLPGGEVLAVRDALARAGIAFHLVKHETPGGFMADAVAHLRRTLGVLVATLGPGVSNLVTAVAHAYLDRTPMLVLTARIDPGVAPTYTHQIFDHGALLRPVTKATFTVGRDGATALVDRAVLLATADPPGPVHLDIPVRVASMEVERSRESLPRRARVGLAPGGELDTLVGWLGRAERPLVLAGLGILHHDAHAELRAFVRRAGAAVITTYKAKGVVSEDDPAVIGGARLSPRHARAGPGSTGRRPRCARRSRSRSVRPGRAGDRTR